MSVRTTVQKAIRRGVKHYLKVLGVVITYKRVSKANQNYATISNLKMLRYGKSTNKNAADMGLWSADDETYLINQDSLAVNGTSFEPNVQDRIIDGSKVLEVVDYNRDALEANWVIHCKVSRPEMMNAGEGFRQA